MEGSPFLKIKKPSNCKRSSIVDEKTAYRNLMVNIIFRREFEEFSLKKVLILIIFLEFSVIIRNYLSPGINYLSPPCIPEMELHKTYAPVLIFYTVRLKFQFDTAINYKALGMVPDIIEGGICVWRVNHSFIVALPLIGKIFKIDEYGNLIECFLRHKPEFPKMRCLDSIEQILLISKISLQAQFEVVFLFIY